MGLFTKPASPVEARRTAAGTVARIAITDFARSDTSSQYRCHIQFEGQPGAASFGLYDADPAIALTHAGDEVRIEVDDKGDLIAFLNMTTGLSAPDDEDPR